ncbi:unnamed protein product [Rangifer tarandus platyrhynchus]|uniref:Uncharacterized protein n=1 Tax=Rangifer tarandus platyrhynchus TaxID=3082113 RepID=A0ABN8YHT6_RANTA|nr:unnamed protein product [Rangifer tarandus platyrhynchus]
MRPTANRILTAPALAWTSQEKIHAHPEECPWGSSESSAEPHQDSFTQSELSLPSCSPEESSVYLRVDPPSPHPECGAGAGCVHSVVQMPLQERGAPGGGFFYHCATWEAPGIILELPEDSRIQKPCQSSRNSGI